MSQHIAEILTFLEVAQVHVGMFLDMAVYTTAYDGMSL